MFGLLPALVWLKLWLIEDNSHPEPTSRLASTFIFGIFAGILAFIIPTIASKFYGLDLDFSFTAVIILIALEEVLKMCASLPAIFSTDDDEPVDAMIYLITTSLGFVAIENAMYAFGFLVTNAGILGTSILSAERFIGASIMHIVASATIGIAFSTTFFHKKKRFFLVPLMLVLAIALHGTFNFLIIRGATIDKPELLTIAFAIVWVVALIVLYAFSEIKRLRKK